MNYMAKLKALELSDRTKNTEFYIKWENRIKERNKKPDDQRHAALRAQKGPMGYSV